MSNTRQSGFNESSGSIGGGFNKAGGNIGPQSGSGFGPQYPGQNIFELFAKMRKQASQWSDGKKYSDVTSQLDPLQDLVKKAQSLHKEVCKQVVDKAWKTAGNILDIWSDLTPQAAKDAAKHWEDGLTGPRAGGY